MRIDVGHESNVSRIYGSETHGFVSATPRLGVSAVHFPINHAAVVKRE